MKVFASVAALAVLILLLFPFTRNRGDIVDGKTSAAMANIRSIAMASKLFMTDHHGSFPDSIHSLVESNYLTDSEFKKLTSNIQIDYFPPESNASSDTLILVGHIPGYAIYGFASADVSSKKLK